MLALHQRMAELWTIKQHRPLTKEEKKELDLCLDANCNLYWKRVKLENFSLVASMVNDDEWQHEICKKLDDLTQWMS